MSLPNQNGGYLISSGSRQRGGVFLISFCSFKLIQNYKTYNCILFIASMFNIEDIIY